MCRRKRALKKKSSEALLYHLGPRPRGSLKPVEGESKDGEKGRVVAVAKRRNHRAFKPQSGFFCHSGALLAKQREFDVLR